MSALSNEELVSEITRSVREERKATMAVIERLNEVYRRCLHLELGYGSLHEFMVKELGYSDGSADRRIQAMKLCEELPKAREAISSGKLSLCAAATMQHHLRRQPEQYSTQKEREELLAKLEGKSKRECERILNPDQSGTPIRFLVDDETLANLERLSECLRIPRSNMSALIRKICRIARKRVDPMMRKPRSMKSASASVKVPEPGSVSVSASAPAPTAPPVEQSLSGRDSYIRTWDRKTVYARDEGCCAFIDPLTGRRCQSRFGLEYDHIVPVSLGGETSPENLRLLCKAHHHLVTVRMFGKAKIEGYIRR